MLREVLDSRMPDSGVPLSKWSRLVGRLLVNDAGLPEPVYEYRILDPSGALIAQVDLAYPEAKVAIELDSIAGTSTELRFITTGRDGTRSRVSAGRLWCSRGRCA